MIETIQVGVQCREMQDTHLIDRLLAAGKVTPGEHAAALHVLAMHADSGFEPKQVASYAPRGFGGGHDDKSEERVAVTRFRELLRHATEEEAMVFYAMALGDPPGVRTLAFLRHALDCLADRWGLA